MVMHMTHRQHRGLTGVIAITSAVAVAFVEGSGAPPRTREGRPDLQGVWSYATLTPLERPAEFAGKAFLTEAEAAAFERKTLDVQNRDRRDGDGPSGRGPDGRTDSTAPTTRSGGNTAPRSSGPDARR